MTDRVHLSASRSNIENCLHLALDYDLGIEVMAFAFPDVLDGDWESLLDSYKTLLAPLNGKLTLHGPFMDMAPGSPDKRINEICVRRYQHAIGIAAELGAGPVVFHANFIATIHNPEYRQDWHGRNVAFWADMADYAQEHGVGLAVENMWEFDPDIITDVLKEVNHPYLRACLDVGHAHLFSNVSFDEWVATLEPWLVHTHVNNNNGKIDVHQGLHNGVLDYAKILDTLRNLPNPPSITLEMDRVADMEISLSYLQLSQPTAHLRDRR